MFEALLLTMAMHTETTGSEDLGLGRNVVIYQDREVIEGELLVQFIENTPAFAQRKLHDSLGYRVIRNVSERLALVEVGAQSLSTAIDQYQGTEDVAFAEPNYVMRPTYVPNDSRWGQQYGPSQINAPEAWDIYQNDPASDVVISVIDTGININHLDLDDNYVYGYDYLDGDSNPNDTYGHGTHCAGIAAADTDNNRGIAGISFGGRHASYRCGNGGLDNAALVSSINDSVAKGFHVLSMSWGGGRSNAVEIALSAASDQGAVLVAAAGNNGNTNLFYPAALPFVLAVAATDSSDNRAGFSTYGDWVQVAAPGASIHATWTGGSDSYADISGTSMACPHVAGMAGLLYSRLGGVRNVANRNRILSVITDNVESKSWVRHGRVDFEAALIALDNGEGDADHGLPPGTCERPNDYGVPTPGTGGVSPHLVQANYATLGTQDWEINLSDTLASAAGVLNIGFAPANDGSQGYTRLVDSILLLPFVADAQGEASFSLAIPNNPFLNGFSVYLQAVASDSGAQNGLAASDGYEVTLCTD